MPNILLKLFIIFFFNKNSKSAKVCLRFALDMLSRGIQTFYVEQVFIKNEQRVSDTKA